MGMTCRSCKAPLRDGAGFCGHCGAEVVAPAAGTRTPRQAARAAGTIIVGKGAVRSRTAAPPQAARPSPQAAGLKPAPKLQAQTYCRHCGGRLRPGSEFCSWCGEAVPSRRPNPLAVQRTITGRPVRAGGPGLPAKRMLLSCLGASAILPDGQRILDDVDLALREGMMVAVVGPTGSGKSTLLKTLTGFRPPEEGVVLVGGQDLYAPGSDARKRIGYVPQDDILHPQLTVRQALRFGAELRFPPSVGRKEQQRRVEQVMAELGLTKRADVRIEKLSGGQRKRVSVAMELLTSPTLLFLDEPTSGLDPGYERSVMELLRKLAKAGRGVVVVTHSVQSLDLCDQVLFLAPGGVEAFFGPTNEALTFFGRSQYASVFQELEAAPTERWKRRRQRRRQTLGRDTQTRRAPAPTGAGVWWRQLWTLCRRQLTILAADRRNLTYLLAEVLIPAILILAIVGSDSFVPNAEKLHNARTLVGALAVSAAVIGSANAIREVVKELPVYYRERSVGLSRTSYLVSKMLVIGAITAVQVLILVLIATLGADGPDTSILPGSPLLELTVDIALGGIAAMALGLLISTMVSSSEKAMALVPVVFIVMWLFSGQAVDLQERPAMKVVGYATSANWSMSLAAGSTSLADIEDQAVAAANSALPPGTPGETVDHDPRWEHDGRQWALGVLALLVLTGLCLAGAERMLARKEPFLRR